MEKFFLELIYAFYILTDVFFLKFAYIKDLSYLCPEKKRLVYVYSSYKS